jgi:hypothetical protein
MDAAGFDTLARSLQRHIARRTALGVLGGGLAALLTRVGPGDASARKKQKHKKKPKLNEFGCVNVGGKCRGKNGLCCSGICQGKKPKKGKKDKSKCVAHNTGGCQPGEDACNAVDVPCNGGSGFPGLCLRTTGQAGFCGGSTDCRDCRKDSDCEATDGPGAACVVCPGCVQFSGGITACVAAVQA